MTRPPSLGIHNVVASTARAAFATSVGLRIVAWNSEVERILGHHARDVIGQPCYEVLDPVDGQGNTVCGSRCPWLVAMAEGQPAPAVDLWLRCADGRRILMTVSAIAVPGDGRVGNYVVHFADPVEDQHAGSPPTADRAATDGPPASELDPQPASTLTPRESEVLTLLAQGKGTHGIAEMLYISPATVRTHIQHITTKLDVHTRLQAVITAQRRELV